MRMGWKNIQCTSSTTSFFTSGSKILSHIKSLIRWGSSRKPPKALQQQPVPAGLSLANPTAWCKMRQVCIPAALHWSLSSDMSSITNYSPFHLHDLAAWFCSSTFYQQTPQSAPPRPACVSAAQAVALRALLLAQPSQQPSLRPSCSSSSPDTLFLMVSPR